MQNLTSDQRRAIIVSITIILTAAVIQWLRPHLFVPDAIDYSESDSTFYRLSRINNFKITDSKLPSGHSVSTKRNTKGKPEPGSIDINKATKSELEKLPRVGPKTAQLILDYRKSQGGFKSISELLDIKGIGPKTLEKIQPYLKEIKTR
jgi:comEA protein